jgi:hypothetical protein
MFIIYFNKIMIKLFRTIRNKTASLFVSHGSHNKQQFFLKPNYLVGFSIGDAMFFLCGRSLLFYTFCSWTPGFCENGNEPSGSKKYWEILSGCTIDSFSRRAQLHEGVNEFVDEVVSVLRLDEYCRFLASNISDKLKLYGTCRSELCCM